MKRHKTSKKFFIISNDKLEELVQTKRKGSTKILFTKYAYILHLIIHYSTFCKEQYEYYGRRINVEKYDKIFGSKYTTEILQDLQLWGYIQLHKQFIPGEFASTYKLTPEYENAKLTMRHFRRTESKFVLKVLNEEKKELKNEVVKRLMHVYQHHVSLSDQGLQYFKNKYPHPNMERLIELYLTGDPFEFDDAFNELMAPLGIEKEDHVLFSFLTRDFYVVNPETSERIYSNISNLKREKRELIHLQGLPMLETDISCSQVVFSIPVIADAMQEKTKDLQQYSNHALSGKFYEVLAKEVGIDITNEESRKQFKEAFFAQVFFSKPNRFSMPIKDAFKRLFPSVYTAINKIKQGNHQCFAIKLQNLESRLINFDVLKTLQDEGHVAISLHDAIYVNNLTSLEKAEELIRTAFQVNYGLLIAFKRHRQQTTSIATLK